MARAPVILLLLGCACVFFLLGFLIAIQWMPGHKEESTILNNAQPHRAPPAPHIEHPHSNGDESQPEPPKPIPAPIGNPADQVVVPKAFVLPADRPLRASWPLDLGPDQSDAPGEPLCLRGRQGINEIQRPGEGKALYAFQVPLAGRYRSYLYVRWVDDRIGSVDCNNSWFAAIDHGATMKIGRNGDHQSDWHWEPGPAAELSAGLHWYRIELREDGVRLGRIALVPEGFEANAKALNALPRSPPASCLGERPPDAPQDPIRTLEMDAYPTRSVVVGKSHINEITLYASWHGGSEKGLNGRITVEAPSVPNLRISGATRIAVNKKTPFGRKTILLHFPPETERRLHRIYVSVMGAQEQKPLFRKAIKFKKPPAWAFLGPLADPTRGLGGAPSPLDPGRLKALSTLAPPARLGLNTKRMLNWRIFADGSCYDELGAVDLSRVYGPQRSVLAYAVTWLQAESPPSGNRLRHRSFSFQSDDSGSVWVHGQLMISIPKLLPKEANRLWSSSGLRRGLNPVVVKVAQAGTYWGFRFDVVDWHWQGRRGDVIRWVEPKLWPRRP